MNEGGRDCSTVDGSSLKSTQQTNWHVYVELVNVVIGESYNLT